MQTYDRGKITYLHLSFSHRCEASLRIEGREKKQDSKKCCVFYFEKVKNIPFLKATTTRKRESLPFSLYAFSFCFLRCDEGGLASKITSQRGRVRLSEREISHFPLLHNRQIRVILDLETFFHFISCATIFFSPCSI